MKKVLMTAAVLSLGLTTALSAGDDTDIPVNGDFLGSSAGASSVPKWTGTTSGSYYKILATPKADKFELEITADAKESRSVISDFHAVPHEGMLKIEYKVRGNGSCKVCLHQFDAEKQEYGKGEGSTVIPAGTTVKKWHGALASTQTKFIRIELIAEPGATVIFSDIEAEVKKGMLPQSVDSILPGQQKQQTETLPAVVHDKLYKLSELADSAEFQTFLPIGGKIEFKLAEDSKKNEIWSVTGNTLSGCCKTEIEHDIDDDLLFRQDKLEVELKGIAAGAGKIVFQCGKKTFTLHVKVQ